MRIEKYLAGDPGHIEPSMHPVDENLAGDAETTDRNDRFAAKPPNADAGGLVSCRCSELDWRYVDLAAEPVAVWRG